MTALQEALAFARQIDAAAAIDAAREWPLHEELYDHLGDLAGGLGWDPQTRINQTLADILPAHCEHAAQAVQDAHRSEVWGENGTPGWLEDEMDRAYAEAAADWLREVRKLAAPMLAGVKMPVAA